MTVEGITSGTFDWTATTPDRAMFWYNMTLYTHVTRVNDNTVCVRSTGASTAPLDASLQVVVDGVALSPYYLSVKAPLDFSIYDGPRDYPETLYFVFHGFTTYFDYLVKDQFHSPLPAEIPVGESFGTWTKDYFLSWNWDTFETGGGMTEDGGHIIDGISMVVWPPQYYPTSVWPTESGHDELVGHISQTWCAGMTVGGGLAMDKRILYFYRGYARRP